jgi:hypothetical protein
VTLAALAGGYFRRREWEFRQQAIHIVNALGQALGGGGTDQTYQRKPADQALGELGIRMG